MSADARTEKKWLAKLTDEQREAACAGDRDLWLTAGAGSGKTSVLTARYLHLHLVRGVPIRRLLAITFTEKAAAEMRERIAETLRVEGRAEALREIPYAPILTIDSLCYRLVREYGEIAGVEPTVEVLDPTEAGEWQEKIWVELLDRWWAERPDDLLALLRALDWKVDPESPGGVDPAPLFSLVRAVRTAGRTLGEVGFVPDLEALQEETSAELRALAPEAEALLAAKIAPKTAEKLRALVRFAEEPPAPPERAAALVAARGALDLRVAAEAKPVVGRAIERIERGLALIEEEGLAGARRLLREVALEFQGAFDDAKRRAGVVDFLDLEEAALRILDEEAPRRELRDRYAYLLLDECQDTNELQLRIVRRLRNEGRLLAVGDAKQSIYAFRDADVSAFVEMSRDLATVAKQIRLDRNFRSRAPILRFVNALFPKMWGDNESMSVPYEELEPGEGVVFPEKDEPSVELLLAEGTSADKAREAEADLLARRLQAIHNDSLDELHYRDMALLFRSTTDIARYERRLRDRGVPAAVAAGRGFFQTREVTDLLVGLALVENPFDDLELAAALRSPLAGIGDEDLAALLAPRGRSPEPLWDRLRTAEASSALSRPGGETVRRFMDILERLRDRRGRLSPARLLETLARETRYVDAILLLPDGLRQRANVRKLLELARGLEERAELSLPESIRRLRDFRYTRLREPESALDTERDAVRLMTIHAAKGMEFPLTVVADMGRKPSGERSGFLFDKAWGVGVKARAEGDEKTRLPWLYMKIDEERRRRSDAEEIRLLYVALTRAKRHLILSGSRTERGFDGWLKKINEVWPLAAEPGVVDFEGTPVRVIGKEEGEHGRGRPAPAATIAASPGEYAAGADAAAVDAILRRLRAAPPAVAPGGDGRTVTGVKAFLDCPRRFRLGRHFPLPPEEPMDDRAGGTAVGTSFHQLMESHWTGRDAPAAPATDEALRWMREFLALPEVAPLAAGDVAAEVSFCVPVGGRPLRGVIDLLGRTGAGYLVIDYKTDRASTEEIVDRYATSLDLYRLAVRALIAGEATVSSRIYAARAGALLEVPEREEATLAALGRYDEAERRGAYPPTVNDHCEFCRYRRGCSALADD